MKPKLILTLFTLIMIGCASKHENFTKYKDADLVFRYIDDSLSDNIDEDEYILATFRIKVACSNCIGDLNMPRLIDTISKRYPNTPIYILTDDAFFNHDTDSLSKFQAMFSNLHDIFYEDPRTLKRYGLYGNYPSVFKMSNGNMVEAVRYLNKEI